MDNTFQYTLFLILAPLATLSLFGVYIYARRHYPSPETTALGWLVLTTAGWLIFNTLELAAASEAASVFWSKISYAFIAFTPVAWLGFALRYTGREKWLARARFAWLCIIPALTTLFTWTNSLHNMVWTGVYFTPVGNMLAFRVDHGPWFWVHTAYSYTLVLLGAFLILRQFFSSPAAYRHQSRLLMIGVLTPIAFNLLYLSGVFPGWKKDYTALSFALASLAFAVGMLRYRLFDLRPVAREAVVDSMIDPMLAVDMQGRIVDLNPAAQGIISEVLQERGRDLQISPVGEQVTEILPTWGDLITRYRDERDTKAELSMDLAGVRFYYDLQVSPLFDKRGIVSGRLVVLRDVTDRKRVETALRSYTIQLEERNQELDAFAHTVAHDLKTPLSSLIGYSYMLQTRADSISHEDATEFLDAITQSGRKMTNIIDELLLLASVRKQERVKLTPLDTGMLVAGAIDRLNALLDKEQAVISKPDIWPAALGYEPWVEEVWVNYISNANKYGGSPPHIELGAELVNGATSLQKPMVRFWVRDNGQGIPLENREHLFTPFSRLDEISIEGHGLGLSIVRRIVEKLDGAVGVESQVGQGSTFWFTLPADQDDQNS